MQKILFFSFLLFVFGCKTNQNSADDNSNDCDTFGTVQDFSDLDGCPMLIVLENGDKLNPAKINDTNFKLQGGQKIKFGYKKMPDMMSTCMSEKAIIEITCIEAITEDNKPCVNTKNPFEIAWMDKALDRHNPQQVIKYKYEEGFAYLFKGIPRGYFYDCKGNFICQTKGMQEDDCFKNFITKAETEGKGKIIWQGEGIWD